MSTKDFVEHIQPLRDRLYRLALLLGRKPAEAEDIVQETLVRYWVRREEVEKPQAWCYQLVRRLAVDQWRQADRIQLEEKLPEKTGTEPDPLDQVALKDENQKIREYLNTLPEKQRLIFQLRDMEGMSYQEIADTLQLPLNQIKVNLHRARGRIRSMLEKLHAYGNP